MNELSRGAFEKLKAMPFMKSQIVSDSMTPILNMGDKILIEVGNLKLNRFDIIVIYVDGKLVCHYLWKMNSFVRPILMQTRNMRKQLDFPITIEDYLGRVVSHKLTFWQKVKLMF